MLARLIGLAFALVVLTLLFGLLERYFRAVDKPPVWRRRGRLTDAAYWFFTPLVTKALGKGAIVAAIVPLALIAGAPPDDMRGWFEAREGPLASLALPLWAEAILALICADFTGYWLHRAFHRGWLWRVHAIHHGSVDLDWLSSVRLHPLNEVIGRIAQTVPLFLLGARPAVLASVAPFFGLYAIFIHANVPWSFGPLRYLIASPAFHRWHHTSEEQGRDRNFAGLLPVWDLLFGTFYLPVGVTPQRFGVLDEAVPEGLLAQLAHPFRRRVTSR